MLAVGQRKVFILLILIFFSNQNIFNILQWAQWKAKLNQNEFIEQCQKNAEKLLIISIENPVGLPGEHDGVHPQAQHEQDDHNLEIEYVRYKLDSIVSN